MPLGTELRIVLALGKVHGWSIGLKVNRIIDPFVGPQTAHGHYAIVNFAQISQVLPTDMSRFVTILTIPGLIDHQHPLPVGCR